MNLNVSFEEIDESVRRMGADQVQIGQMMSLPIQGEPIRIKLKHGIEIGIEDVEIARNGLLTYKGQHVLIYIQDHGWKVEEAERNGADGKKFHVSDCRTIDQMKHENRFQRYVATNEMSGKFFVTGTSSHGEYVETYAYLNVCKNCLQKLNYRNYTGNRKAVFAEFSIEEFFAEYESTISQLPDRRAGGPDGKYTDDWPSISEKVKQDAGYRCKVCQVDLGKHRGLLHVHHTNGVKNDNHPDNLRALCALCHAAQPGHGHMKIRENDALTIRRLRKQ